MPSLDVFLSSERRTHYLAVLRQLRRLSASAVVQRAPQLAQGPLLSGWVRMDAPPRSDQSTPCKGRNRGLEKQPHAQWTEWTGPGQDPNCLDEVWAGAGQIGASFRRGRDRSGRVLTPRATTATCRWMLDVQNNPVHSCDAARLGVTAPRPILAKKRQDRGKIMAKVWHPIAIAQWRPAHLHRA
jgi:hypothetical protein